MYWSRLLSDIQLWLVGVLNLFHLGAVWEHTSGRQNSEERSRGEAGLPWENQGHDLLFAREADDTRGGG